MVSLVRKKLLPLLSQVTDAHAGLLVQRGLRVWQGKETQSETAKNDKTDLIDTICCVRASPLYQLAFDRWLIHTFEEDNGVEPAFATLNAQIDGRLMTGLATGGTLETGVMTQHSYGMPMLAGSAVKGAVRAYAETLFSQKDAEGQVIVHKDDKGIPRSLIDPAMQPILNVLFGADDRAALPEAGYLIWHDAWWIPALTKEGEYSNSDDNKPFTGEIVTVHHPKYYADSTGKLEALDMESPIPNQQLAVQGSFYFVIEGDGQWVKFARQLLENMLQQWGMGAKGASGYGYFKIDDDLNRAVKKRYKRLTRSVGDSSDIFSLARALIEDYSEKQLYEGFAKAGRTKAFQSFNLDKTNPEHCAGVVKIVLELYEKTVDSWGDAAKGSNMADAFKFINQYR